MMSTGRMKIIEMLRLSEMGLSQMEVAASAGCGKTTVGDVLRLCEKNGITYEIGARMTGEELQNALHPRDQAKAPGKPKPDWKRVQEELAKHKNLNLQFIWEEYREQNPD